jgi:hypothetical protein
MFMHRHLSPITTVHHHHLHHHYHHAQPTTSQGMADPQTPPAFLFANGDHLDADSLPQGATVLATRPDSAALCVDWGGGWVSTQVSI